jgi:hypothetical protein
MEVSKINNALSVKSDGVLPDRVSHALRAQFRSLCYHLPEGQRPLRPLSPSFFGRPNILPLPKALYRRTLCVVVRNDRLVARLQETQIARGNDNVRNIQ